MDVSNPTKGRRRWLKPAIVVGAIAAALLPAAIFATHQWADVSGVLHEPVEEVTDARCVAPPAVPGVSNFNGTAFNNRYGLALVAHRCMGRTGGSGGFFGNIASLVAWTNIGPPFSVAVGGASTGGTQFLNGRANIQLFATSGASGANIAFRVVNLTTGQISFGSAFSTAGGFSSCCAYFGTAGPATGGLGFDFAEVTIEGVWTVQSGVTNVFQVQAVRFQGLAGVAGWVSFHGMTAPFNNLGNSGPFGTVPAALDAEGGPELKATE